MQQSTTGSVQAMSLVERASKWVRLLIQPNALEALVTPASCPHPTDAQLAADTVNLLHPLAPFALLADRWGQPDLHDIACATDVELELLDTCGCALPRATVGTQPVVFEMAQGTHEAIVNSAEISFTFTGNALVAGTRLLYNGGHSHYRFKDWKPLNMATCDRLSIAQHKLRLGLEL